LCVINKEDALPVFDHLRKSQRCLQNSKELKLPDQGFTIFKEIQQPSRAGQAGSVCAPIFTVYNNDTKSLSANSVVVMVFCEGCISVY